MNLGAYRDAGVAGMIKVPKKGASIQSRSYYDIPIDQV